MSDFKNYLMIARIMMVIEIILLIFTLIIFHLLQNIVVGIYLTLYFVSLFLWIPLFILTVNLYYKAKKTTKG